MTSILRESQDGSTNTFSIIIFAFSCESQCYGAEGYGVFQKPWTTLLYLIVKDMEEFNLYIIRRHIHEYSYGLRHGLRHALNTLIARIYQP